MTAKTAPKITLWEFFQQLGKTFMLPVALLSFCGIMLGIGSSLSSHDVLTLIPALGNPVLQAIFTWMSKVGSFAFSFLPVMFCIAIPLGLARENKGVAAFAGFVGYAVMNLAVNFWLTAKGILPTTDAAILKANNVQNILGIQSIDTGILGAVIAGIIVWMLHERFHNIRLPDALAQWTSARTPAEAAEALQSCGVAAGPMNRAGDLLADPQLRARATLAEMAHPLLEHPLPTEAGPAPYRHIPPAPQRPAPLPGADTRQVCREVLAMDDTDIEGLITNGVLFSTADAEQRGVPG